jgi:hypothetical protein
LASCKTRERPNISLRGPRNKGPKAKMAVVKTCNERRLSAVRMKVPTVSKNEYRDSHGNENTAVNVEPFRQLS